MNAPDTPLPQLPSRSATTGGGPAGPATTAPAGRLPKLLPVPVTDIDVDELAHAESAFVAPAEYEEARKQLTLSASVLVLTGPRGIGKRTMALRLLLDCAELRRTGAGDLALKELVPDWEWPDAARLPVDSQQGYLLDLSGDDKLAMWPFAKGLRVHAEKLRSAGSFLVITTTDDLWRYCDRVFEEARLRLVALPGAREIAEQRLAGQHRRAERVKWLDHPMVRELLGDRTPPADAVRLAAAVAHATDEGEQGIDAAVDEFLHWRRYLRQWFGDHPAVDNRALMLAAAALDGSPEDDVFEAADTLLDLIPGDAAPISPLAGPGRTALLDTLDVEPGEEVSIAGRRPGLDDAVLDYVLDEYPQVQEYLYDWIVDLAFAPVPIEQRDARAARVARVLTGLAARRGEQVVLDRLPALAGGDDAHRGFAARLLALAVLDPVVGAAARRRIVEWAEREVTSQPLVASIAEICGEAFGHQRPTAATAILGRILRHHATTNGNGATEGNVPAALGALLRVADQGERHRLVLGAVVRWLSSQTDRYAGGRGFVELVQPDGAESVVARLLEEAETDSEAFGQLAAGWRLLPGSGVPDETIHELISAWVGAAAAGELRRELATDLLVLAMEEDIRSVMEVAFPTGGVSRAGPGSLRLELLRRVLDLRRRPDGPAA
jgi:hypothetical protein